VRAPVVRNIEEFTLEGEAENRTGHEVRDTERFEKKEEFRHDSELSMQRRRIARWGDDNRRNGA
jgi:hypothetical protein